MCITSCFFHATALAVCSQSDGLSKLQQKRKCRAPNLADKLFNLITCISPLSLIHIPSVLQVLPVVDENIWQLSLYNNVNASFLFLPLILIAGETQNVMSSEKIFSGWFWVTMLTGGVFGFAIGYVNGLLIQVGFFSS